MPTNDTCQFLITSYASQSLILFFIFIFLCFYGNTSGKKFMDPITTLAGRDFFVVGKQLRNCQPFNFAIT